VSEIECAPGRIEQRDLRIATLDTDISSFPHARQVLSCTRVYIPKKEGEIKKETRYFITSIEEGKRSPAELARIIREHWSIENLNHWKRDASLWREDRSPLRAAQGAKNLALLRNAALAILPFEEHDSLNAAFDYYRDYRGQSLKLFKNGLPFPE
jgi:predicted transposase YbfD/YdcC